MDYDRVIVLHQGRIAEFDSVQALLANRGSKFAAMVAEVQAQQQQKNNGSEGKKPS
jgi:ABC-type multidrug transport system fused ATPase/permease subunit